MYCLVTEAHRCGKLVQGFLGRVPTRDLLILSPTLYKQRHDTTTESTWKRDLENKICTADFSCSWKKKEAADYDTAGWRQVVCVTLCHSLCIERLVKSRIKKILNRSGVNTTSPHETYTEILHIMTNAFQHSLGVCCHEVTTGAGLPPDRSRVTTFHFCR